MNCRLCISPPLPPPLPPSSHASFTLVHNSEHFTARLALCRLRLWRYQLQLQPHRCPAPRLEEEEMPAPRSAEPSARPESTCVQEMQQHRRRRSQRDLCRPAPHLRPASHLRPAPHLRCHDLPQQQHLRPQQRYAHRSMHLRHPAPHNLRQPLRHAAHG